MNSRIHGIAGAGLNDDHWREAPTVSVIIPAYDAAAYISEALDSVFAQTFTDFEVIVINDGSPDTYKLEKVIEPYVKRIIYIKQENRGPSGARNAGIGKSRGKYIAFLDSDDSWLPDYLAVQVKMLEETPSLDMAYCDSVICGDSPFAGKSHMEVYPPVGAATFENLLSNDVAILPSFTVVRKQAILNAGLFDESLFRAEDYDLWLRIAHCGGKIARQEIVLGRRRWRPEGMSQDSQKMLAAIICVLKKVERNFQLPSETQTIFRNILTRSEAEFELEQGKVCLFAGDFVGARAAIRKANTFFPRNKLRLILVGLWAAPHFTVLMSRVWERCLERIDTSQNKVA